MKTMLRNEAENILQNLMTETIHIFRRIFTQYGGLILGDSSRQKGVVDMQILNLSKEDSEAIIRLDATELTTLCNALYYCRKEMVKNETYHKIYGDLTMARNFASYGHIDDFAFNVVEKQRRYLRKIERDRRKGER